MTDDTLALGVDEDLLTAACVDIVTSGFLVLVVDAGSESIVSVTPGTARALGLGDDELTGRTVEQVLDRRLIELPGPRPQPGGWSTAEPPLALTAGGTTLAVRLVHRAQAGERTLLVLRDLSETVEMMAGWQAELGALTARSLRIEFTPSGEITQADERALELFGHAEADLVGRPHDTLCDPQAGDDAGLRELWTQVPGEPVDGVFRRRTADGEPVWLRGHYIPIPGIDGRVARIVLIAEDAGDEMRRRTDLEGKVSAIDRSQAVIEFALDGTVLEANDNFLSIMDYDRSEVVGFHHRAFVLPDYAESAAYQEFWSRLRNGEFISGEFHRLGRDDRDIWLQATYNPVLDPDGRPWKVIKYALDITAEKNRTAEFEGKVVAIDRSQAVIEFGLDGTVITANQNFLRVMGYELDDVIGRHHRMFLAADTDEADYEEFWHRLRRGEFVTGEFRRRSASGEDVWLRATYNPVLDPDGRPWKVIKYALDVTAEKMRAADYAGKMTAIDRSQLVIEFATDGTILSANQNFQDLLGYTADELAGQHHRVLVRPDEAADPAYDLFWERLARGEFNSGEYRRVTKDGSEVWIRATYNPVFGADGKPYKIVKFATDVTGEKLRSAELSGRLGAVDRAQAVAEFDLGGKLLTANENFMRTMGYAQEEILGQPHSMFCTREYVTSDTYRDFWMRLRKGELISGRFHRKGKFGRDVWIQASYSPIPGLDGRPLRVIKYAYDVTGFVSLQQRLQVKSRAMAETAQKLGELVTTAAGRCTRSDLMVSQAHDEARAGSSSAPATLLSFGQVQRTVNHVAEAAQILADLSRQSNQAAFGMTVELNRDQVDHRSVAVIVEEVRRVADRSNQAALEISRLAEDVKLEINHGYEAARRAETAFERVGGTLDKVHDNVEAAADVIRGQQVLVAEAVRLIGELENTSGGEPEAPGGTEPGVG
ncbi:methyl-accepting chemotaxis protein [Kineosporia sp. J2-2]|uniref:Methyl-accepting chemotaxis protein n=1 Tax=Kineosporia corallincola TaxID=2835133 RepID=A0ABS5TGM1_9ACTN|nr:PAS domain-containing protein [Kineosporia corallincola]MBT0769529.1 methyl-accepting chemotaxis protein [Kineosporia corallincola]